MKKLENLHMTNLKAPELLLPAGSLPKMRAAFDFGADAIYAGQPRYSLRARNNEPRFSIRPDAVDKTIQPVRLH